MTQGDRTKAKLVGCRELSVTVHPEAEEAMAEWLERETGVTPVVTQDRETGWSTAAVFMPEAGEGNAGQGDPGWRRRLREGLREVAACGLAIGPGTIRWRRVRVMDWAESWKRHFPPLRVGGRLLVRPSWSRRRPGRGEVELVLDPGLSFGTGQHPTTLHCLRELVRLRGRMAGSGLLDVGTGSGILALAGARLGYEPVVGFDFDEEAVAVALGNAERNGLVTRVQLEWGDAMRLPRRPSRRYGVVCANLTADVLLGSLERLRLQVVPGGYLVVAGILAEEFERVSAEFEGAGLRRERQWGKAEWCSGTFRVGD